MPVRVTRGWKPGSVLYFPPGTYRITTPRGSRTRQAADKARGGFLGFQTRLATIVTHGLDLRDNHSIVMSDFYVEQADNGYFSEGGAGDPPGRATLTGAKFHSFTPQDPSKNNVPEMGMWNPPGRPTGCLRPRALAPVGRESDGSFSRRAAPPWRMGAWDAMRIFSFPPTIPNPAPQRNCPTGQRG